MKKPKIKFPKLKNPVLCKIILYAPAFLWMPILLLIAVFEEELEAVLPGFAIVILMLVLMIFALVYLFHNPFMFLGMDVSLEGIRLHLKDRKFFQTDKNGSTRTEEEKIISRRMSRLGYTCEPNKASPAPLLIKFYSHYSWTVFYARIEKICLLYSVAHLDAELYRRIMTSASSNIIPLHGNKDGMRFIDKQKKKAPIASAAAVIILADSIDEKIPSMVRRDLGSYSESIILPCVADISSGRYYFDSLADIHIPGLAGKPAKNFAIEIIKKAVFGGLLPLQGNDNLCEMKNFDPEATLWEAIAEFNFNEGKVPFIYRMLAKRVKPGQFKFRGNYILCKIREKAMAFPYKIDSENEKHLHVTLGKKSVSQFGKNLSKKEFEALSGALAEYLEAEGYTYTFSKIQRGTHEKIQNPLPEAE